MKDHMKMRETIMAAALALGLCVRASSALELLSEDFESPDVTAAQSDGNTSGAVPPGWVGATQGFGASRRGIVDEAHGDFTDPVGEQAFAFRYTNSGLTSGQGQIGAAFANITYTVTFDVVMDGHNATTPYNVQLVAFASGATRNDCRDNNDVIKVLASTSGNATTDGNYTTVSFSHTIDAVSDAAVLGEDLAVRFKGATSSAIIDNVLVTNNMETVPPHVYSLSPASNATDIALDTDLVITFDETVVTNAGNLTLTNLTDNTAAVFPTGDPQVSLVTSVLTVNASVDLLPGKTYAVLIDPGTIRDVYITDFPGIADTNTWRFQTSATDTVPPSLLSVSPTNFAKAVLPGANLVATFSENVVLVSGGVVTVTNLTDGTATSITLPDPAQVTASGTDITIHLSTDLDEGDTYAVLFDANAIDDTSGNSFVGINDTVTWRFETAGPPTADLNGGATDIGIGQATLNGVLTDGDSANVYICWGTVDGGTGSTSGWQNVVSLSTFAESSPFSTALSGLYYGIEYDYRVYATNGYGDDWSALDSFATSVPAGGGGGDPVAGAYFEWDAAQDLDGNDLWPSTGTTAYNWQFDAGGQTPGDVSDARFTKLTKAYAFPGAKDSRNADWTGHGDNQPATFEFVLDTDVDDGVIFESGGSGDGIMIDVAGGAVRGMIEEDPTDTVTSYALTATDKSRFIHVIFTADNVNNVARLYVDGDLKDTQVWSTGDDWSGTDDGGLGAKYNSVVDGGSTVDFAGRIALFRYYRNTVFDVADVMQNFDALSFPLSSIGISNNAAVNVGETTADLVGTLNGNDSVFTVYAYYSTNDNLSVTAWTNDADASVVEIGTFTNVTGYAVTGSVSSLTGDTTYYYTMMASNAVTNLWATPNATFHTQAGETDPPVILALYPTNGQTDVPKLTNLVATFDEQIYLIDGGEITLTNLTDGTASTFTIPDPQVSVTTSNLTIDPPTELHEGDTYAVLIDNAALQDVFNNVFLGINDTGTWRFTIADTLPTLVGRDIVDDQGGGPIYMNELVTYTVTFSEDMDAATVTSNDFANGGTAPVVIGAVNETSPGVFTVEVTPTNTGSLLLEVPSGAVLEDIYGNALDTTFAIQDDTNITIEYIRTVFTEDFEIPSTPTAYSQGTRPAGWVGATAGYRANYHGITDKAGGDFSAPDPNHQAYAFRYSSNAGVTTDQDQIGLLRTGVTYFVSFDVVRDDGRGDVNDVNYDVKLIAFADSDVRTDVRSTPAGSLVIASATGASPGDGSYATVTFSVTGDAVAHAGYIGYDLGLRFRGSYDSALIDNVVIRDTYVPDTTPPTLASNDIVDDQGGGPVAASTSVTYTITFSEDMDDATVTTDDFSNAGTSAIAFGALTEIADGVFTLVVTPSTAGTLQLQVNAGAILEDLEHNALDTGSAIADDTVITVTTDTTPPTLDSIVDDRSGGPVPMLTKVTYTVTFNEDINATTVTAADFDNAGSATIVIDSVAETSAGVFEVVVTPTSQGTLRLQVPAGAVLQDTAGNGLDTSSAIQDDTTLDISFAQLLLFEDFESPATPTAYSKGTLPDNGHWVGSNAGFGSDRKGITDKAGGDFAAPDPNHQAFAFRYTNSGVTTGAGAIGNLARGATLRASFDVVRDDGGGSGTPYIAQLIAFAPGAARNDCRSTPAGSSVLASASGNAPGDGTFATVTISFEPNASHAAYMGYDLGLRFIGGTTSASIDNVVVLVIYDPATHFILK